MERAGTTTERVKLGLEFFVAQVGRKVLVVGLLFGLSVVAWADEPGMIAFDSTANGREVYVPDPILLVHGIASAINTYAKAIPTLDGYFRDGSTGQLKYAFNDTNKGLGWTFGPFQGAVGGSIDSAVNVRSPMAGYDYRSRTGNGDQINLQTSQAMANAPSISELPLPFPSGVPDGFGDTLMARFFNNGPGRDSILENLVPLTGIEDFIPVPGNAQAIVVAHSMGGLVTRSWIRQSLAIGKDIGNSKATVSMLKRVITLDTPNDGSGIGNCGTALQNAVTAIDAENDSINANYGPSASAAFRMAAYSQHLSEVTHANLEAILVKRQV